MTFRMIWAAAVSVLLAACSPPDARESNAATRIVSLDYCADQYVLRFANRENILALSPEADRDYSYLREQATGLPQVRPRTADIMALQPDVVVRSYGGGPNITGFLERAGIRVIQVGFPQTLADVRAEVVRLGSELGQPVEALAQAEEMDRRLNAIPQPEGPLLSVLYMAPRGVTAGEGSLIHELITAAGYENFQDRPGWNPVPLERLAYEQPDLVAVSDFGSGVDPIDNWSASRHPIAKAQMRDLPVVPLQGAWTSCGGWFQLEVVEALAEARSKGS